MINIGVMSQCGARNFASDRGLLGIDVLFMQSAPTNRARAPLLIVFKVTRVPWYSAVYG